VVLPTPPFCCSRPITNGAFGNSIATAKRRCSPSGKRSGLFPVLWCGGFADGRACGDKDQRQSETQLARESVTSANCIAVTAEYRCYGTLLRQKAGATARRKSGFMLRRRSAGQGLCNRAGNIGVQLVDGIIREVGIAGCGLQVLLRQHRANFCRDWHTAMLHARKPKRVRSRIVQVQHNRTTRR